MAKIPLLSLGWSDKHRDCFNKMKEHIRRSVELAHPSAAKDFYLFSDASDQHWAVMLTQVASDDSKRPVVERRHEPLAFLSGSFKGAAMRWSTVEKEAYPIVESLDRLKHFLLREKGFIICTDHRNLVYILNPSERANETRRHVNDRLERWAAKMMGYRYTIHHIAGVENVWADLLTRWAREPDRKQRATVSSVRERALNARIRPLQSKDFIWPTIVEIVQVQQERRDDRPEGLNLIEETWVNGDGRVWILNTDLRTRICVVAHCGCAGHRGIQPTTDAVAAVFWWPKMNEDVKKFVQDCLHCEVNKGVVIPRQLGSALHATKRNDILHYDFLFMDKSKLSGTDGFTYVLVIQDDFSMFRELIPAKSADHRAVVTGLLNWFSRYGIAKTTVSDQGSHFKNMVIEDLHRILGIKHHFTTAYVPWANGTVERANRDILFVTRALLSEFRLQPSNWPDILPMIQYSLNHTTSQRLGGHSPAGVFGLFTREPAEDDLFEPYSADGDVSDYWGRDEGEDGVADKRNGGNTQRGGRGG